MSGIAAGEVADAVSRLWAWHRTPRFLAYVAVGFGRWVPDLADFDRLFVWQTTAGDIPGGVLMPADICRWWVVDDGGIRECRRPDSILGPADTPEKVRGSFYREPLIGFLLDGGAVCVGEQFGPGLLNRRVGKVARVGGVVEVADARVIYRA